MTDPTPTRDEAVREHADRYHKRPFTGFAPRDEKRRKQVVSLPMDVLLAIFRERLAYLQHGSDLDAVAQFVACEIERAMGVFPNLDGAVPAPASGGVHAVREALLGYVLKPGQYETASVFARGQNRVAVDMLGVLDEASLSPAATPVSGADMIPRAKNVGRYLAETNDGRLLYLNHATEWQEMPNILAKPASSPAGGDVVQTLIDKTEKLIEAADDMGWSCNSSSADQAIREAKDAVRAALSQSTSPDNDPTASGETVGIAEDYGRRVRDSCQPSTATGALVVGCERIAAAIRAQATNEPGA